MLNHPVLLSCCVSRHGYELPAKIRVLQPQTSQSAGFPQSCPSQNVLSVIVCVVLSIQANAGLRRARHGESSCRSTSGTPSARSAMRGNSKSPPRVALHAVFAPIWSSKRPNPSHVDRSIDQFHPTFVPLRTKPVPLAWRFCVGPNRSGITERKKSAIVSMSNAENAAVSRRARRLWVRYVVALLSALLSLFSVRIFPVLNYGVGGARISVSL